MVRPRGGVLLHNEREQTTDKCNDMDESQVHTLSGLKRLPTP